MGPHHPDIHGGPAPADREAVPAEPAQRLAVQSLSHFRYPEPEQRAVVPDRELLRLSVMDHLNFTGNLWAGRADAKKPRNVKCGFHHTNTTPTVVVEFMTHIL